MDHDQELAERGQVNSDAARVYEDFFVPALFGAWAAPACEAAGVARGHHLLDIGCGTGVGAREALSRVGPEGRVTGLDCNPGMLAVARENAPGATWREGLAEALPFETESFDAVLCLFGLMFFEDRAAALREIDRVLRPGGRAAVLVWDAAERSPGYARMIALIERLIGIEAANALRAPFALGDRAALDAVLAEAGWQDAEVRTEMGQARFPSLEAWVHTDVRGWTLADMIDEAAFQELQRAVRDELGDLAGEDGAVVFPAPAHVVVRGK